ncbi:MAG: hypothetical protein Q8Q56_00910, partial [Alphaproteobacteria bacterium]|nr:hypothetical protein [Alphaproteobacteria bacterium]
MALKFGFQWHDLYDSEKLSALHQHFLQHLSQSDPQLYADVYAANSPKDDILIPLAMAIESFIVDLLGLNNATQDYYDAHHRYRLA